MHIHFVKEVQTPVHETMGPEGQEELVKKIIESVNENTAEGEKQKDVAGDSLSGD